MGIINLMGNDVWSEADIMAHGREVINSHVSVPRQDELRTIMLGHIAQMRVATPDELAEIALVQQVTEVQVLANAQARADMVLLAEVLAYEHYVAPEPIEGVDPEPAPTLSVDGQALFDLRHPVVDAPAEVTQ